MSGILAIDPGTKATGWAHADPGMQPTWGHERMGRQGDTGGQVYYRFRLFLTLKFDELSPELVVFEAPFVPRPDRSEGAAPLNAFTSRRSYGWTAHIEELCEKSGIGCYEEQSSKFTKFFTGRGRFPGLTWEERRKAKKDATVAACWARGWRVTDDEADALALLLSFESERFPEAALRRPRVLKQPRGPLFKTNTTLKE